MRRITTIVLLSLLFVLVTRAQPDSPSGGDLLGELKNGERGNPVIVHLDSLIEENYYKHLVQNRRNSGIPGYRIRIFSDNGLGAKDHQKRVRARFLSLYPEIDAYYRYDGTYFKLYVGDCRTKSEAYKLLREIRNDFPEAFIVQDDINIEE